MLLKKLIKLYTSTVAVLILVLTLPACSTRPSIQLIAPPKVSIEHLKPAPSEYILSGCEKLLTYDSDDRRDVLKVTIRNYNLYFLCSSKLNSAVEFIKATQ